MIVWAVFITKGISWTATNISKCERQPGWQNMLVIGDPHPKTWLNNVEHKTCLNPWTEHYFNSFSWPIFIPFNRHFLSRYPWHCPFHLEQTGCAHFIMRSSDSSVQFSSGIPGKSSSGLSHFYCNNLNFLPTLDFYINGSTLDANQICPAEIMLLGCALHLDLLYRFLDIREHVYYIYNHVIISIYIYTYIYSYNIHIS
jgi:hypothetical protein